jgi:hypothetical protein
VFQLSLIMPLLADGRRVPRGLFGALVAFLLLSPFPGLLVALPLAALLLQARPGSLREWSWIGATALLISISLAGGRDLARDLLLGYGVTFTAAVILLSRFSPGPAFPRVAVAAVDSATLICVLVWALGLPWTEVRAAVDARWQAQLAEGLAFWRFSAGEAETLRRAVSGLARVYPAIVVLGGIAGGMLARSLAWHITGGRIDPEPGRFRDFQFNDHLIWGAIVTLGLVLAPLAQPWSLLALNLLVVWAGVYAARGMAVAMTILARWSLSLRLALCISGALLLPYAAGALMLVGIADTWLDLRRIHPPTQGVIS